MYIASNDVIGQHKCLKLVDAFYCTGNGLELTLALTSEMEYVKSDDTVKRKLSSIHYRTSVAYGVMTSTHAYVGLV